MAVRFDASTERYTAANGTGGTAFTACCWAYQSVNRADFQVILAFENAGSSASQGMYLMTGASGLGVSYYHQSGNLSAAVDITVGNWFKFAFVQNGTTGTLYGADATGTLAQVATGTVPAVTKSNIFIGTDSYGEWWNGRIAGVKAWNAVLTLTELQAELASYTAVRTSNLIRVHKLQVPETTDYSGNGNTLTGGTGTTTEADPPISGGGSVSGVAAAALGALTATATAIPTVNATAAASLGALTGSAAGLPTVNATGAATLGALTAAATGTPTVLGSAASTLGGLTAAATAAISDDTQAAVVHSWGSPVAGDEFGGDLSAWSLYSGPGQGGDGLRDPDQITITGGIATISGTADGTTGGMALHAGERIHGRWEARMRIPLGDDRYHPVLILWPTAEDWPEGGEVDYAETGAAGFASFYGVPTMEFNLHYSVDNLQERDSAPVDITGWHNYAVEWSTTHVVGYIDGVEFFRSADTTQLPPRTMHPTVQLDWFPDGSPTTGTASMDVAWLRIYDLVESLDVLTDDFTVADESKWQYAATADATIDSGHLAIACTPSYPTLISAATYDLTGSEALLQVVDVPTVGTGTTQAYWGPMLAAGFNELTFQVNGANLIAESNISGSRTTLATATYSPSTHRWQRIRESGATIFWDVSADGSSWSNFASLAVPFDITEVSVEIGSGYYGTETSPGSFIVDNLNLTTQTITGDAAAVLGALTATATGTRTLSGTAAATMGGLTATATATRETSATAAAPLGALTSSATAVVTVPATAAAPLGVLTGTATGSRIWAGTAAASLGALTAAASGVPTVLGVASAGPSVESDFPSDDGYPADDLYPGEGISPGLGALVATAVGIVSGPEVTGTATATLGGLTAAAVGDVTAEVITATATAPLGALTSSGVATRTITAAGAAPLGALTAAAAGTVTAEEILAVADAPLGVLTGTATGVRTTFATADTSLGSITATATADLAHPAVATAALGAATCTATGGIEVTGTATAALGDLAAVALGGSFGAGSGAASAQLGPFTATAVAVRSMTGTAAADLGPVTATATATTEVTATAAAALGGLNATAIGVASGVGEGTATAAIGPLTAAATATVEVQASATSMLGGLTAAAVGDQQGDIVAVASAPLGPLTSAGIAVVEVIGIADAMLGTFTATATGGGVTTGIAVAQLGALQATAVGAAFTPSPYTGPLHAGTPTQTPGIRAGTPLQASGPRAGTPQRLPGIHAGEPQLA